MALNNSQKIRRLAYLIKPHKRRFLANHIMARTGPVAYSLFIVLNPMETF